MRFIHKVQYYETDKMGIVHHSNFIRWFEEARVDFLERIGLPYEKMEEKGIFSPVLEIECRYEKSVCFGENAEIKTELVELGNVKFAFKYRIINPETGEEKAAGTSRHCFINSKGKPVSLKKELPEEFEKLKTALICE